MNVELKKGNSESYAEIVEILTQEGHFNIFEWSDAPGAEYSWHTHPANEVRWILKGSILIGTETGEFILRAGDRLDVEADTRHWAKTEEGVTYVCASR